MLVRPIWGFELLEVDDEFDDGGAGLLLLVGDTVIEGSWQASDPVRAVLPLNGAGPLDGAEFLYHE